MGDVAVHDEVPPTGGVAGIPMTLAGLIRRLPDHLPELIVVLSESGDILWYNATAEAVLGWPREHWTGRNVVQLLHQDDQALALELLVSARATGPGIKEPVTYRLASAYDTWLAVEAVACTVQLESERTVLVMSARPGGRVRESERIAEEVTHRLSRMFEHSAIGLAQCSLDARILRANRALGELVGLEPRALLDVPFAELVHPDDRERAQEERALLHDLSDTHSLTVRFGQPPHPLVVGLTGSLVPDWQGEPMYYAVQVVDVTALAHAEQRLRETEQRLHETERRLQQAEQQLAEAGARPAVGHTAPPHRPA